MNLAEFEKLTGGDDFTEQLIAFEQHNYSFAQFFENIVKEKGIPHLRSIAIKMVAEELFDSEYIREDKTGKLKSFKTSAIQLANFLKDFSDELGESQDDAYLSGLFFYLPKLAKVIVADESQGLKKASSTILRNIWVAHFLGWDFLLSSPRWFPIHKRIFNLFLFLLLKHLQELDLSLTI